MKSLLCIICGNEFTTVGRTAKYCSKVCKRVVINAEQNRKNRERIEKNGNTIDCKICGVKLTNLTFHIKHEHGISSKEYKIKYDAPVINDEIKKKLSESAQGEKNPGYKHGGRLSPWSYKSEYHTDEEIKEAKKKAMINHTKDKRQVSLEYYLCKGMTEQEAIAARSERQRTFTLEKCISKYGEQKGKEIFAARQEKWHKSFSKTNFSNISQELFWGIALYIDLKNVFFAELSEMKTADTSGSNNEYIIRIGSSCCKPDFIDICSKKIIEFDGDYWHGESRGNQDREYKRDQMLRDAGYEILHVKERDFKKDRKGTISECLKFLKGQNEIR